MTKLDLNQSGLKLILKEAMAETLREQRDLLHDVFAEVLEDFALAEAIREGQKTQPASPLDVARILGAKQ